MADSAKAVKVFLKSPPYMTSSGFLSSCGRNTDGVARETIILLLISITEFCAKS